MKQKIKKDSRCYTIVLMSLFVFLFELLGTISINSIMNNSSEFNVLAMAADIAGYEWKDTMLKNYYYGFTSSILFSIVFLIKPLVYNSYFVLHGTLIINIILNTICAILLFLIIENIIKMNDWDLKYYKVALITTAISLFLSSQVLTKTVTNENFLILCYYVVIYILTLPNLDVSPKKKIINSVVLSIFSVLAYATNGRGIILIIITSFILILTKILKIKENSQIIVYFLGLGIGFVLISCLKDVFVNAYFTVPVDEAMELKNNDFAGMLDRLVKLFNLTGLKLYIKLLVGWGIYFTVSTYGLGIVAFCSSIKIIYSKVIKKIPLSDNLFFLAVISILFLAGSTLLGIVFYYDSFFAMNYDTSSPYADGRVDKLIYGRYISTIKPIIISVGLLDLIYIVKNKTSNAFRYIIYTLIYVITSFLFMVYLAWRFEGKKYAAVDIPEFALFFGEYEANYKFGIVPNSIMSKILFLFLLVFLILLLLDYFNKQYIMVTMVLALNILMGVAYQNILITPRSEYYYNLVERDCIEYIIENYRDVDETLIVVDENAYLYQFNIPTLRVVTISMLHEQDFDKYQNIIFICTSEQELKKFLVQEYKGTYVEIVSTNSLNDKDIGILYQEDEINVYALK